MSDIAKITALREERNQKIADMRGILDKADAETRDLTAEEQGEYDARESDVSRLDVDISRRERMSVLKPTAGLNEDANRAAARDDAEDRTSKTDDPLGSDEYRTKFVAALRSGFDQSTSAMRELRALSVGTNTAGGFAVPTTFRGQLLEKMREVGVIRSISQVIQTASGEDIIWPVETDDGAAHWRGEAQPLLGTDPAFGEVTVTANNASQMVKVSWELLQDSFFDIETYLRNRLATNIGRLENTAFVAGDGVNKPLGFTVSATVGKTATSQTAVTTDELIDLMHSVLSMFRKEFVANDTVTAAIRKLKFTGSGEYAWTPGGLSASNMQDSFLGKPWHIDPDMPAMTAGLKPIAFGDFSTGYLVRDAGPILLRRLDERFADTGQVAFIANRRVDGKQIQFDAIKTLQMAP